MNMPRHNSFLVGEWEAFLTFRFYTTAASFAKAAAASASSASNSTSGHPTTPGAESFRRADLSFFLNNEDRAYAVQHLGVSPERARITSNGIANELLGFPFSPKPNGNGGFKIALIGSYSPRKFTMFRLFLTNFYIRIPAGRLVFLEPALMRTEFERIMRESCRGASMLLSIILTRLSPSLSEVMTFFSSQVYLRGLALPCLKPWRVDWPLLLPGFLPSRNV